MPKRSICTTATGAVLVATFHDGGRQEHREYCQYGRQVYVRQRLGGKLPDCVPVAPDGRPLLVRRGETLEAAVRRMLDAPASAARVLTLYDVAFALSLFTLAVAALTALALGGLVALAVIASAPSASLKSDAVAVAALGALVLGGAGLRGLWRTFPTWQRLLLAVALLTALGLAAGIALLAHQTFYVAR